MGDRLYASLDCAHCGKLNQPVYYALAQSSLRPSAGFESFRCAYCGKRSRVEIGLKATIREEQEGGEGMLVAPPSGFMSLPSTIVQQWPAMPADQRCTVEGCTHRALHSWEWAPGHFGGYRCGCCARKVWEETLENVTRCLAKLPDRCDGGDG